ncbi:cytochrome b-c1 complex subunit 7-like isoform X1 [Capsicum galapagoense]
MHMKTLSSHLHNYAFYYAFVIQGLRYDDLYDPMYDLDVKEALNRLPREIVDAKNQYLLCAMDLFMKHLYLPEDLKDGRIIDSIDCTDGCRPSKMYFLRTLIEKTLKDREDFLVEPNSVSNLIPPDEYWDYLGRWFCLPIQSEGAKILRKDGHNWRRKDGKTVKELKRSWR